jgi:glucans biosynthesis protein
LVAGEYMSNSSLPSRRSVLVSVAAAVAGSALGWPGRALSADQPPLTADGPFTRSTVTEIARALSKGPFVPPTQALPAAIADLNYDQYQAIYFKPEEAVWAKDGLPFQMQLFHRGFYYKDKIEVATVDDGQARHLAYSPGMYAPGKIVTNPLPTEDIGFAGLRIHGHINRPDYFDEIVVFEGASYFRSLAKGQVYGVSARGLALKVGAPDGEEFPIFRAFWVETPEKGSDSIAIHALLDSKSLSGAYRFTIRPGLPTAMDVEATLFPRVDLISAGLAPGTSMFYFDGNGRQDFDDWRPEVHDSDGLLIINGQGERIWRPLANPKTLQFSAFVDSGPRGFGLMQRDRDYDTYQDYNASYEKRPSLWIEPVGDWGKGSVVLVEIPNVSEVNDNIVAYWSPQDPIKAGAEFAYAYRMFWGNGPNLPGVIVAASRRGRGDLKHPSPIRRFVIDYVATGVVATASNAPAPAPTSAVAPATQPAAAAQTTTAPASDPPAPDTNATSADPAHDPKPTVTASSGVVSDIWVEPNPASGGWRVTFNLDPQKAELIELRAALAFPDGRPVDTWLYRWTA